MLFTLISSDITTKRITLIKMCRSKMFCLAVCCQKNMTLKYSEILFCPRFYKVVQIWPGRFVCKQVTVSPGHIWTTLYMDVKFVCHIKGKYGYSEAAEYRVLRKTFWSKLEQEVTGCGRKFHTELHGMRSSSNFMRAIKSSCFMVELGCSLPASRLSIFLLLCPSKVKSILN
jgi:hypothetical protein